MPTTTTGTKLICIILIADNPSVCHHFPSNECVRKCEVNNTTSTWAHVNIGTETEFYIKQYK